MAGLFSRASAAWPLWRGSFVAAILMIGSAATAAETETPIPPTAKDFTMEATQSDQYEIVAGRVAVTQSNTPRIVAFAQAMIDDHARTQRDLAQAAAAAGLPSPDLAMSSDQASLVAALQGLRGPDFDKAYARQQVLAHSQALAVERSYADLGTEPNLRAAAKEAVPMIQQHLETAQQVRASLGAD